MIEQKMQNAANALPENYSDFSSVECRMAEKSRRPKPNRRMRLVLAMVLAVLLVGCMSVTIPEYHLYNGNWWQFIPGVHFDPADTFGLHWQQTQKAAEKLDITLPETLGGNPVIDYDRFNLTEQETPLLLAWMQPRYVYQGSYYGINMVEPYISPDGTEGTLHWREGAEVIYGPTDDEIWRRQFGFDENDVYTAGDYTLADHPVVEITSLDHEGITIFVGQIGITFHEMPRWSVSWVDYDNGVVFSIAGYYETPDEIIEYAKEIIDLN